MAIKWARDSIESLRALLVEDKAMVAKTTAYREACKDAADAGLPEPPYPYDEEDTKSAERTRVARSLNQPFFDALLVVLANKRAWKDDKGVEHQALDDFMDELGSSYFAFGYVREYYSRVIEKADLLGGR